MKEILDIQIPIPPLETQNKIVNILDKFSKYEAELVLRNKQYEYYRNKLLSFDEQSYIQFKRIEEILKTIQSPIKLNKNEYQNLGSVAIIDQGQNFIAGYSNINTFLKEDEYIIFGDHTEIIKFINFPFIQGCDGIKILKTKLDKINLKFIYYCFTEFYKKEYSYKRHWTSAKQTLIPIPPLETQNKIVNILDKFNTLLNDINEGLPKEKELRKKQYEYYRDKLLNFK